MSWPFVLYHGQVSGSTPPENVAAMRTIELQNAAVIIGCAIEGMEFTEGVEARRQQVRAVSGYLRTLFQTMREDGADVHAVTMALNKRARSPWAKTWLAAAIQTLDLPSLFEVLK